MKFILIFEHSTSVSLKDPDIKLFFQRLHQAYIDCVSNPFYEPNTQLKSKRFEQVVSSLMIPTDSMSSSTTLPPPCAQASEINMLTVFSIKLSMRR